MSVNTAMTALADAIRSKTGGTDPLSIDGMTAAVNALTVGSGLPEPIVELNAGSFEVTASSTDGITIDHGLSAAPTMFIVWTEGVNSSNSAGRVGIGYSGQMYGSAYLGIVAREYQRAFTVTGLISSTLETYFNETQFKTNLYVYSGYTYKWIAWR